MSDRAVGVARRRIEGWNYDGVLAEGFSKAKLAAELAADLRAYAEEVRQEERDVAAKDAQMRYEDGYACGVKDERERWTTSRRETSTEGRGHDSRLPGLRPGPPIAPNAPTEEEEEMTPPTNSLDAALRAVPITHYCVGPGEAPHHENCCHDVVDYPALAAAAREWIRKELPPHRDLSAWPTADRAFNEGLHHVARRLGL